MKLIGALMEKSTAERQRVRGLISKAGIAMLMTVDDRGDQAGRPMLVLALDGDARMYFLTRHDSRKVGHITARPQVALTVVAAGRYFLVTGQAVICHDRELLDRLWHPTYRAWFPEGVEGGEALVLRIEVDRIDYWEPPRSRVARVFQAAMALVTQRPIDTPMKTIAGW
jgi:general stress protein 26